MDNRYYITIVKTRGGDTYTILWRGYPDDKLLHHWLWNNIPGAFYNDTFYGTWETAKAEAVWEDTIYPAGTYPPPGINWDI
jgi:hypothetical protein